MTLIRARPDGRSVILAEQSEACVLEAVFSAVFGREAERLAWLPAQEESLKLHDGDCVVLALSGASQSASLCRRVGIPDYRDFGTDSYAIEVADSQRGKCLAVLGGSHYGLIAGVWDVLLRSDLTKDGLVYRGGPVIERPAFSHRFFWSWDHSANWSEGPGQIDWGCNNAYCKPPEAFMEDCRSLIDYAPQARANGVIIAGFLRDDHGGVAAARQVLGYGRLRHVRVLPAFCSSGYSGLYYQGAHPFNEECRRAAHPDHAAIGYSGKPLRRLCQSHPATSEWQRAAMRWLASTLNPEGAEIEFSDYAACQCPRCKEQRGRMGGADADYLKELRMSYAPCLEQLLADCPDGLFLYAVFTGFNLKLKMRAAPEAPVRTPVDRPDLLSHLPQKAVCLWTITEMLHEPPVPLASWLDEGKSGAFYEGDLWPPGLRPPASRNMALMHQGSYWWSRNGCHTRYGVEISSIKEACLRGAEAGLEGLVLMAETSSRSVPCELNYQAFAHFTYHPEDSLREFACKRLAPLLGGEDAAQLFVQLLAETERSPASPARYRQVDEQNIKWREHVSGRLLQQGEPGVRPPVPDPVPPGPRRLRAVQIWRRWEWLRLRALRGPTPTDSDYLPFP